MYRLMLILALAACSSPDDIDPAEDTDADTDADSDSDSDSDADSDTDSDTDTDADTDADACDPRVYYASCGAMTVQTSGDGAEITTASQWDGSGNLIITQQYDEAVTTVLSSTEWTYTDDRLVRTRSWYGSTLQVDLNYSYDAEGNLVEQREAVGGSVYTFTHDEQGREIGSELDREGDGVIDDTCTRLWSETDGGTSWSQHCSSGVDLQVELDERGLIVTYVYHAPSFHSTQTNVWRDDCQMESAYTESASGPPSTWQATYDEDHRQVLVEFQSGTYGYRQDVTYTCE